MKHLFKLWIAATLLFIAGCSESYDDSEVWNSINSLEKRMSAMETVMNAYKNKLSIDSLTPIENGYRITFSDGSQATITNGKGGDTYIEKITIGENEVTFILTDGRQLTIPLSSSYLFKRIQSITYLPAYEDGKANMVFRSAKDSYAELDFLVSPKEAVSEIEEGWEFFLSMQGYHTKTRSVDFIEMKITNCFTDADSGVLTITVSGENLCEEFYTGEKGANGVLKVSDGNTDIDSNIVPFIAVASETPPNNEIWYTTSDNKMITPAKADQWGNETSFGANIISNTYIDGKGVITFDGDITQIGNLAFANHEWNNFRTKNLTDIRLPDCVTKISSLAFSGCNLEEFRLPKNLSIIESAAFEANNFKQITIPSNVTFIGEYAFQDNKNLTEVTNLSKDLLVVDGRAFRRCKLQSFKGELSSTDGRCLIKNGTLVACATSGLTEYSIPDNVKTISSYAFALRDYLTKITIPEGVTKIEEGAFNCCI